MPAHKAMVQDLSTSGSTAFACDDSLFFVSGTCSKQHPHKRSGGIPNADAVGLGTKHLVLADGVSQIHDWGLQVDALPRELVGKVCEVIANSVNSTRAFDGNCVPQGHFGQVVAGGRQNSLGLGSNTQDSDAKWLVNAMRQAYELTQAHGATTLLVSAIRGGNLVVGCLGDSALLLLRPIKDVVPLQLYPVLKTAAGRYNSMQPIQVQRLQGFPKGHALEVIAGAAVSSIPAQSGDIVVLGSDGLFDNLADASIAAIISHVVSMRLAAGACWPGAQGGELRGLLSEVAAELVDRAVDSVPWRPGAVSPWISTAPRPNADDTTALVAVVMEEDVGNRSWQSSSTVSGSLVQASM